MNSHPLSDFISPPIEVKWDASLETGLSFIDEQHKEIVVMINELYSARFQNNLAAVRQVLIRLNEYVKSHCALEEELMTRSNYPFKDAHEADHRQLEATIQGFITRHDEGEDVGVPLQQVLFHWLGHIRKCDFKYIPFVKKFLKSTNATI